MWQVGKDCSYFFRAFPRIFNGSIVTDPCVVPARFTSVQWTTLSIVEWGLVVVNAVWMKRLADYPGQAAGLRPDLASRYARVTVAHASHVLRSEHQVQ